MAPYVAMLRDEKIWETYQKIVCVHGVRHFADLAYTEEFKSYETSAYSKGFLLVSSSPLTRSSHHAGEDFARLQQAREAQLSDA